MSEYFSRHRLGRSQIYAALLLVFFLVQSAWLVHESLKAPHLEAEDQFRLQEGLWQWRGRAAGPIAGTPSRAREGAVHHVVPQEIEANDGYDPSHSPLWYLIGAAPVAAWSHSPSLDSPSFRYWAWLTHIPFLACGLALGASLWYVARRLCGNQGGFIALILYCFSPAMIRASALWHTEPEVFAAWGTFGTVFTAIAVAHTLYAPREVVLWNWRRIGLLGISLWISVGSQFSMVLVVPVALAFLLYAAPVRRGAAIVIWLAACMVGVVALSATYFFRFQTFADSLRHASFWGATWRGFTVPAIYWHVSVETARSCPALAVAMPVAVVTYVLWPRTRYFGNTAPLLVAILLLGMAVAHPHLGGEGFFLAAFPFLYIFVAGVLADLMETQRRSLVTACLTGMLAAYAIWSLRALAQVAPG